MAETPPSNTKPTAEGLRKSGWRRARPWAIGGGIGLLLASLLAVLSPLREKSDERALTDLGFSRGTCNDSNGSDITPDSGCLALRAKPELTTVQVAAAMPSLRKLGLRL
ncbi:hypothetical protein [Burkholderia ubonensis]|uniref:hypothetical protein n=1 Tax=Burkholderia ubonensis TaxID=101571 RepID=UPI001E534EB8|nr:hypothetical protein [Burkholderia ubonensis]